MWQLGKAIFVLAMLQFLAHCGDDRELPKLTPAGEPAGDADAEAEKNSGGSPGDPSIAESSAPAVNYACGKGTSPRYLSFEADQLPEAAEGLAIADQFQQAFGMRFSLVGGGAPVLARRGIPATAISCTRNCGNKFEDGLASDYAHLGEFFLTDDGLDQGIIPIVVTFDPPVTWVTLDILDPDAGEIFSLQALDTDGGEVAVLETAAYDSYDLDGKADTLQIGAPKGVIARIMISGRGQLETMGFAIDRLMTSANCSK